MVNKNFFRVILRYEERMPDPYNKYAYFEKRVRLYDQDNFASIKKTWIFKLGKIKRDS